MAPCSGTRRKQPEPETFNYDARTGEAFADITDKDQVASAVASGRLVRAYIIDPMFGGAEGEINTFPAPPSVQPHLDAINQHLASAIQAGKEVSLEFAPDYRGDSFVPASVSYQCGDAGVHTVSIW